MFYWQIDKKSVLYRMNDNSHLSWFPALRMVLLVKADVVAKVKTQSNFVENHPRYILLQ